MNKAKLFISSYTSGYLSTLSNLILFRSFSKNIMQGKVTIGYWAIRGLSERLRQIAQYTGTPYDEVKYSGEIDGESRKKWFNEVKPELQKKNPAITLPYLIDGDKVISESDACCVYLCHRANRKDLLGRNADEQVALYTALGVLKDMHPNYITYVYRTHGSGANLEENLKIHREFCRSMNGFLKKFNGMLGEKKFMCSNELVWIDFALADFFQTLNLLEPMLFDNYPNLLEYQKRVWGLPELKAYFESERFAERPCNNTIAKWK